MDEYFEISLDDIRFFARHGVMEQERILGNEFSVALRIKIPVPAHIHEDNLEDTISYADIYEIVDQEMKTPRKLLETLSHSIASSIREKWRQIVSLSVSVTKLNPPISGITGSASVTYNFSKKNC